jgi:hypothetical protein
VIDEHALAEKAANGSRFKEVLPIITECMDEIEAFYARDILNCGDRDERDNLWRAVQVCRKVKAHVGSLAASGAMASHQLAEIRRLR